MSFDRQQLQRARDGLRKGIPRHLRTDVHRAFHRLGRYGVRIAKTLVAVDTGRTKEHIRYDVSTSKAGRGWEEELTVSVASVTKDDALAAIVTEFGRGHGKAAAFARGHLPPRPYLRPSRTLVRKRATGAITRAMRKAARTALSTGA